MNDNKKFNTLLEDDADQPNTLNGNGGYTPNSALTNPDLKKWSFSSDEPEVNPANEVKGTAPLNEQPIGFMENGSDRYRCEALSLFKVDGLVVSKSSTMTDFTVTIEERSTHYTVAKVSVQNTYMDNNINELNSFNDLLKTIASVKDNLVLKVDNSGGITNILNKEELKEKWLNVKQILRQDRKFNSLKADDQKQILQGGDDEYLKDFDMTSFINKGHTLYTMLFCGYWRKYELQETYDLKPQIKKSGLFKDREIPLEVYSKVKRYTDDGNCFQLEIQAIEDRSFKTNKLKDLYKEIYPFAKLEFDDYSYDYSTNIEADTNTGWIKTLGMTVVEEAGSIVMFMDCTIKKLDNEKSNTAK